MTIKLRIVTGVSVLAAMTVATPVVAAPQGGIPQRYLDQEISWKSCYVNGVPPPNFPPGSERLECGTYTAPMDWFRPDSGTDVTVAVSRLSTPGPAKGTMFVNPGGPGAPGRTFPLNFLATKLAESQEIYAIDPRGTSKSTTVSCGDVPDTAKFDYRDRSESNVDNIIEAQRRAAVQCQQTMGELGKYIRTDQTVRDFDLLRAILKRPKVNWYGASAGTWLGAQYATAFPDRLGAIVLDSNTVFTKTWQESYDWQPLGFERRFREDFARWTAQNDAVYHLGTTAEDIRKLYERIRAALASNPAYQMNGNDLDTAIVPNLYFKRNFPDLAKSFGTWKAAVDAAEAKPITKPVQDTSFNPTFWSVSCNDTPWEGGAEGLIRNSAKQGPQYPLLGWGKVAEICAFWDRPDVRLPRVTGIGLPPILMVQSLRDPATPYEGAVIAHRKTINTTMITVDDGDHGVYGNGNTCVDPVVEKFIVDGTFPKRDMSCPGLPDPSPTSEPTGMAKAAEIARLAAPVLR